MIKRTQRRCMAVSVDIDSRDDRYLRRFYLEGFQRAGLAQDVAGIRRTCAEARARGLSVFPPCDNTDARGHCQGHDEPAGDALSLAEVP